MKAYVVDLKEKYPFLQGGSLQCVLMDMPFDIETDWKRPAVIVVPGGGYGMVSKREGEPVAAQFLAKGFQTFVLTYLCQPDGVRYPEQLFELSCAVDYVKKNAKALCVNPDEIFVIGFSAGGHLTGTLAVEHQNVSKKAGVELDCKPTATGLCYPVISSIHGHLPSYENLLDGYTDEAQAELLKTLNLDEAVSKSTPPAFIWATAEDQLVPADNSIRYAWALDRQGISYELHIYPTGEHGLSVGDKEICTGMGETQKSARWVNDCIEFFHRYVKEPF